VKIIILTGNKKPPNSQKFHKILKIKILDFLDSPLSILKFILAKND